MNLEQSIAAICEKHDIRTISINFTPTNAREHTVLAYVHDCDGRCESGYAADVGTAITNALALLRPEPVVVSDDTYHSGGNIMKIEIDLENIFRDEDGNPEEGFEETIRRQVISRLSEDYRKRLFDRFDIELGKIMSKQIEAVMAERMPRFVDEILDAEYVPVSSYGSKGTPTNFRKEIVESIAKNLKYEPKNYSSEENAFTRAVKSVVELKTNEIKKELTAQIDTKFRQDAIAFAVGQLSERLGLNKK